MGTQWEIDFDYNEFEKQLYDASFEAFTKVQEDHKDETFYTFSLTSSHVYETAGIACNTVENLTKQVSEHHKKYSERMNISLDDVKAYHRYNYWEYPQKYTFDYSHFFHIPQRMLNDFDNQTQDMIFYNEIHIHEEGLYEITHFLHNRIERAFLKVISRLDTLHTFEQTNTRENITLHLNRGDSESVMYDPHISMINPPDVYLRFEQEAKRMQELAQIISEGYYRKKIKKLSE